MCGRVSSYYTLAETLGRGVSVWIRGCFVSPRVHFILAVLAVLAVVVVGATGYVLIEPEPKPTFVDAAYMTVITVSTVGFTEVWPLSDRARLWTMGIIAFGIVTVSYALTSLVALVVSGALRSLRERKRMEGTIRQMRGHVIMCGFGRAGALAAEELTRRHISLVVIEISEDREQELQEGQVAYVIGDATDEKTLIAAGAERARALVTLLPHDVDNVYAVLTARTLRPDLEIIARAEQPATEAKLKRAGASRVVCPQVIGATRIANIVTRPNVVDFVDLANKGVDLELDEYLIGPRSALHGVSLRDSLLRERSGASVVAIKKADGKTLFNPLPDAVLEAQDTLILVGPAGMSGSLDDIVACGPA